jgi:hypothetical protein
MKPMGLRDRTILGLLRAVPRSLASHVMHLLRDVPSLADKWGYHVRPIHYYDPLPDFRTLKREQLERRRSFPGIAFDIPAQARRIEELASRFGAELRRIDDEKQFPFSNEYFAGHDAAVYFALVRDLKPRRIVEIGAGYSTRIAARALEANQREGSPGTLTVIEPYPEPRLTESGVSMELIVQPVERADPAVFDGLGRNDILFIDSSHALRTGGDVAFEFLELLPRLRGGVWVHVHDIFFPFDYPPEWVLERRLAFNEQYLLEAFLDFNEAFVPAVCNYWLAHDYPETLQRLLPWASTPAGETARGASFWMARK